VSWFGFVPFPAQTKRSLTVVSDIDCIATARSTLLHFLVVLTEKPVTLVSHRD
jgi:hypothetical protein